MTHASRVHRLERVRRQQLTTPSTSIMKVRPSQQRVADTTPKN